MCSSCTALPSSGAAVRQQALELAGVRVPPRVQPHLGVVVQVDPSETRNLKGDVPFKLVENVDSQVLSTQGEPLLCQPAQPHLGTLGEEEACGAPGL